MPSSLFLISWEAKPNLGDALTKSGAAVVEPMEETIMSRVKVKLDRYPKVDLMRSKNVATAYTANFNLGSLSAQHLQYIDWQEVFFALQHMKAERGWYNLNLRVEDLQQLMADDSWYELAIPKADLAFTDFGRNVAMWQDITICLLRGYIDQAYKKSKAREEQKHLSEARVSPYNIGVPNAYVVEVRNDLYGIVDNLKQLQQTVESGAFQSDALIDDPCFKALSIDHHLYKPLLFLAEKDSNGNKPYVDGVTGEALIKVSPVPLNLGERNFVNSFRNYCMKHKDDLLKGKEVYLLRNESKKGLGFFEANNFYPDFILWILDGEKQYVTFIDPKGIRNLKGLDDPKIQLFKYLQTDVAQQMNNPKLKLNSFIISNTSLENVSFWSKATCADEDFRNNHVLFSTDDKYIEQMLEMILC